MSYRLDVIIFFTAWTNSQLKLHYYNAAMANCVDDEIVKSTEMNNFFEFNDDNQVEDESNFVSHKVNFVVLTNQLDEHDKCETLA